MDQRISWSHLKEFFRGHWVELTDVTWDWNKPSPTWVRVRNYSLDRNDLLQMIQRDGAVANSTILYMGATESIVELHSRAASI